MIYHASLVSQTNAKTKGKVDKYEATANNNLCISYHSPNHSQFVGLYYRYGRT